MPIFYGVYIDDARLSGVFDLLRFTLEPDAFRFAHITLRGPYKRKLSEEAIQTIEGRSPNHWIISMEGLGRFFTNGQNTIFVTMDIGNLRSIWHKPDFPNGKAHITLYDGRSREVAAAAYSILSKYNWRGMVSTSKLRLLQPKIRSSSDFFHQLTDISRAYDRLAPNGRPSLVAMDRLDNSDRLRILESVVENLNLEVAKSHLLIA